VGDSTVSSDRITVWMGVIGGELLNETNMDYPGNDFPNMPLNGQTQASCLAACNSQPGCVVCVLATDGNCSIKYQLGSGIVSDSTTIWPATSALIESNIDYPGNDFPNMPISQSSVNLCAAMCRATSGCNLAVFAPTESWCWLKSLVGGRVTSSDRVAIWMDYSICLIEQGIDYPGNDITNFLTIDMNYCGVICRATTDCTVAIFGPSTGTCWLKSQAPPLNRVSNSDRIAIWA